MLKSFFAAAAFSILLFDNTPAQSSNSLQINGGIIMPMSSSKGLTTSVQYNYALNENINVFLLTGYSYWDKYRVTFLFDYARDNEERKIILTPENDHILIPFYLGSRINLHTNKLFTSFINFQVGYSYLSYNTYESYNIREVIDPESGEIIDYVSSYGNTKKETEDLFSLGIGAGLSHPMTNNLNLVFSFNLNTNINSDYYGLFSTRGTYTMFSVGFDFSI